MYVHCLTWAASARPPAHTATKRHHHQQHRTKCPTCRVCSRSERGASRRRLPLPRATHLPTALNRRSPAHSYPTRLLLSTQSAPKARVCHATLYVRLCVVH